MSPPLPERIHILHVDDEPGVLEMSETFLRREDDRFSIDTARSAAEALDRLDDRKPDCIVSDYDMPGRNGLEFLEAVRERYPGLPFILFTGKGSEEVASDAIPAGVTDYLQKEISGAGQYTVLTNRIINAVDQYRSQAALEVSQKRLSLFIEQSPLGVLEYDEEFTIVGLNPKGEEILGYSEAELTGYTWRKLVTERSYENIERVTDELARAEGGYHSIDENVRKDGERIMIEWHNRIVTDDDGAVVATFSQFRDVTDRIERQERLRETTARLKTLFEDPPDMINIHDTAGNIIDPNPQLCRQTGYEADELGGMKVWDLDQALDPVEARNLWTGMERGDQRRVDGVYRRKDGSTFPVEAHVRRLELTGEDRFVVFSRDVSERVERERELTRTNSVLSSLVQTLPVAVLVENSDRELLVANDRLFDLFDIAGEPEALAGTDCRRLAESVSDRFEPPEAFLGRIGEILEAREPVYDEPVETTDGRVFARTYEPIDLPEGVGHLWVYRDTTEENRRQERLRRQNERLDEFATLVAHDLRNPLSVVSGRLDLARSEGDSEHLRAATDALDRSLALISDLLALARQGAEAVETEPVDLSAAVAEGLRTIETGDSTVETDADLWLRANRSQLQQLLGNLLRNAIDHGGPDVTVTVRELEDDEGFYVADDGPGIPASDRDRVFEAGYSTADSGTGFGLRIVQQIADGHDWTVTVTESRAGGTESNSPMSRSAGDRERPGSRSTGRYHRRREL